MNVNLCVNIQKCWTWLNNISNLWVVNDIGVTSLKCTLLRYLVYIDSSNSIPITHSPTIKNILAVSERSCLMLRRLDKICSGAFLLISWPGRFMDNPDIFEGKLNKYFAGWNLENTGGFDQYNIGLRAFLKQAVGDARLKGCGLHCR